MKIIILRITGILYGFVSISILGATMLSPFAYSCKDVFWWHWGILYFFALLVMGTQKEAMQYFDKYMD